MVNTIYHKSINKTLISKNYFDGLQKRLLLRNSHPKRTGFTIGILRSFRKGMTNTWNICLVINKVTRNTSSVMRNRTWQSESGYEPTDCDRYDYHKVTPDACGSRR
jgi:hypothetical protein